jgi:hypothetical protein
MNLGTKNRQAQTAKLCKQHLRDKHSEKLKLVEEYILEVEGTGKDRDLTRWGSFTDIKGLTDDTLKRVERDFDRWLDPSRSRRAASQGRRKSSRSERPLSL